MPHVCVSLWLTTFIVLLSCFCLGEDRVDKVRDPAVEYLRQANEMLERIAPRDTGGTGSWNEILAVSRAFARALSAGPMVMESMYALLMFLLAIPEHARVNMTEAAAEVLLHEGLVDSASCLFGNVASASPQDSLVTEILYRRSLDIEPVNPVTVRSFGFALQKLGRAEDALRLYDNQLHRIPNQPALYLTRASLCPHVFKSTEAAREWYLSIWDRLAAAVVTLRRLENPDVEDLHVSLQQLPSVGWQYIGFPMTPLVSMMNEGIITMDPGLTRVAFRLTHPLYWKASIEVTERRNTRSSANYDDHHTDGMSALQGGGRIRLGIVMERRGNASPERVMHGVLKRLDRDKFEVIVFAQDTPQAPPGVALLAAADRVVYLPGHYGFASIAEPTHVGGGGTISLGMPSLHDSRKIIEAAQLDCMLYLAMGSSLLQQLLSMGRLAPLQFSFGLGHPVTSGHSAVDFFVSSDLFEVAQEADERGMIDASKHDDINAAAQTSLVADVMENRNNSNSYGEHPGEKFAPLGSGSGNHAVYAEQIVLFDSFTGVFKPPREPSSDRVKAARERLIELARRAIRQAPENTKTSWSNADDIREKPSSSNEGIRDMNTSTEFVGSPSNPPKDLAINHGRSERYVSSECIEHRNEFHFYHCLQDMKKFHPAFDFAIRDILEKDSQARILLPLAAKVHLGRWEHTLAGVTPATHPPRATVAEPTDRLLFLPEMEHPDMMEVVAACNVMLAPWGWGAGITSFEALAVGVPVVTAPSEESILHFARGEVALLGLEEELVASGTEDYVLKAVRLGTDRAFRSDVSRRIMERRGLLFDDSIAVQVAVEWGNFLERALRTVHY